MRGRWSQPPVWRKVIDISWQPPETAAEATIADVLSGISHLDDNAQTGQVVLNVRLSDLSGVSKCCRILVGQSDLVYVCPADEETYRITVHRLGSNSGSCPFGGRCLVTTLAALKKPAFALCRGRSVRSCVLPLLVSGLARF